MFLLEVILTILLLNYHFVWQQCDTSKKNKVNHLELDDKLLIHLQLGKQAWQS